jgi:hypothetical protein
MRVLVSALPRRRRLTGAINVEIQAIGKFTDPTFSFTEGPLFVGTMGALSATPGTAFVSRDCPCHQCNRFFFVNIQPTILKV